MILMFINVFMSKNFYNSNIKIQKIVPRKSLTQSSSIFISHILRTLENFKEIADLDQR